MRELYSEGRAAVKAAGQTGYMVKKWLWISVLHLLFAALMGAALRLYSTGIDPGLVYGHLLHAHSHTAMMGWVYLAATALIYHHFSRKPGYKLLFAITIGAVWGLMISFALRGYGLFSILFCTIHLLCSYGFVFKILKETRPESSPALSLLRAALYLLVLSTLGIWAIGPFVALFGKDSELFAAAIQFYLHFQFNGFFYFAVLALLFKTLDIRVSPRRFRIFFISSLLSAALTFALPLSRAFPGGHWHAIQVVGVILQAYAVISLLRAIRGQLRPAFLKVPERALLRFSLFSFLLKTVFPLLLIYPQLMDLSHEIRSIAIAYIHLVMLGMISGFLVFFMIREGLLRAGSKVLQWAIRLFITGFFVTEFLLFFQGLQLIFHLPAWPYTYAALAGFSLLLPAAAAGWLFSLSSAEAAPGLTGLSEE